MMNQPPPQLAGLQALAAGGGAAAAPPPTAPPNPSSPPSALPAPLSAPPPPTGVGEMPLGNPMSDPKAAAKNAILGLMEVKNGNPAMSDKIDGWIAELRDVGKKPAGPGGGEVGGPPIMPPPI